VSVIETIEAITISGPAMRIEAPSNRVPVTWTVVPSRASSSVEVGRVRDHGDVPFALRAAGERVEAAFKVDPLERAERDHGAVGLVVQAVGKPQTGRVAGRRCGTLIGGGGIRGTGGDRDRKSDREYEKRDSGLHRGPPRVAGAVDDETRDDASGFTRRSDAVHAARDT